MHMEVYNTTLRYQRCFVEPTLKRRQPRTIPTSLYPGILYMLYHCFYCIFVCFMPFGGWLVTYRQG